MSKNDSLAGISNVVSLADEGRVKQVLVNSILGLWDVVNSLTQLKPSKRERYRARFSVPRASSRERSATKRPSAWRLRWPRWAATLSAAAAQD
jgi:hypothetical protein